MSAEAANCLLYKIPAFSVRSVNGETRFSFRHCFSVVLSRTKGCAGNFINLFSLCHSGKVDFQGNIRAEGQNQEPGFEGSLDMFLKFSPLGGAHVPRF